MKTMPISEKNRKDIKLQLSYEPGKHLFKARGLLELQT